jgi:hypothetical protein
VRTWGAAVLRPYEEKKHDDPPFAMPLDKRPPQQNARVRRRAKRTDLKIGHYRRGMRAWLKPRAYDCKKTQEPGVIATHGVPTEIRKALSRG